MRSAFPLFQSHLDLAHAYWERLLQPGDWAIDATCGGGYDTIVLAEILGKGGGVIGIDIQAEAICRTQQRLLRHAAPDKLAPLHLFEQSHETFPPLASKHPIRLIIYNLGYLPRGDKSLTTLTMSTLQSVKGGLNLVQPGGALSITCYPGHLEGAREEQALLEMLSGLPSHLWSVCSHRFFNRPAAPHLLLLQKAASC